MANAGYTSPFPTSHDTIGQSTLATPLFMPSSPPQDPVSPPESPLPADSPIYPDDHSDRESVNNDDNHAKDTALNQGPDDSRSPSPSPSDLDARLAEYTLDFSQFPSGHFSRDGAPLPELKEDEEDKLSDVGGPEDFTANMEKYLFEESLPSMKKYRKTDGREESGSILQNSTVRSRQPVIEDDGDSADYSEFGPPVDMSTPSHVLNRTSTLAKDSNLEDIEEDPADDLPSPVSPSLRRISITPEKESHGEEEVEDVQHDAHDLLQRIEDLEEEVRDRDDQLSKNHKRVLEAASAGEQIRHLQDELQRKNTHLEEAEGRENEVDVLREQLESLQKQNEERGRLLEQFQANASDKNALEQKVRDMQQQLETRDTQNSLDAERLETIAHLREQLKISQEQLKKRDLTLEETMEKLRETTRAKEVQLNDKNTEIDRLKAELDDQALENERLDGELDRVNSDYLALEDRFTTLEAQSQPLEDLEERNLSLEADLTRVQSQVEAQENALKAVAADLPGGHSTGGHSTYSEILDLIKDIGHTSLDSGPRSPLKDKFPEEDDDLLELRHEIEKLRQEAHDATAGQKAADIEVNRLRQQTAESQALIKTIETENSRLTLRVNDLSANLNKTQHELTRTQEEHAESLETVARLHEEALGQPPSPPLSPPTPRAIPNTEQPDPAATAALEASHQAQIRSLQTAHSTSVSTLRSSHAESMRKVRDILSAAEKRESDLRTELTTLRSKTATQESKLRKSFKQEVRRLEAVIAAKDETSAAVDQRIALSVDKREQEWERRVDLLLEERDRMAKALMMYWGEKEMGRGPGVFADGKENRGESTTDSKQGQAYRYKYAPKHKSRSGERKA
ncbi:hypothetical protein N7533_010729 [Penicillium manginii]|jgi:myosin heavy subunit|uniref:uncharacterized protein n=1 Tax=Penicillium manginii TaxID=203109 RepID=UPI002546B664|nr:uncharacterized protein N7533_010729 [Penicillium manginii]KAJ5741320.1 hypothetical protein N7533_010729 [Penicillium manginii]